MEDDQNTPICFYYSEQAAQQFGYSKALLKNGKIIRFTCQFSGEAYVDYQWEDKQLFGPISKDDIESFTHENFLNIESQLMSQFSKRQLLRRIF